MCIIKRCPESISFYIHKVVRTVALFNADDTGTVDKRNTLQTVVLADIDKLEDRRPAP